MNIKGDPSSVNDGLKDFSDIMFVLSFPAAWLHLHLFMPSQADTLVTKLEHLLSILDANQPKMTHLFMGCHLAPFSSSVTSVSWLRMRRTT